MARTHTCTRCKTTFGVEDKIAFKVTVFIFRDSENWYAEVKHQACGTSEIVAWPIEEIERAANTYAKPAVVSSGEPANNVKTLLIQARTRAANEIAKARAAARAQAPAETESAELSPVEAVVMEMKGWTKNRKKAGRIRLLCSKLIGYRGELAWAMSLEKVPNSMRFIPGALNEAIARIERSDYNWAQTDEIDRYLSETLAELETGKWREAIPKPD